MLTQRFLELLSDMVEGDLAKLTRIVSLDDKHCELLRKKLVNYQIDDAADGLNYSAIAIVNCVHRHSEYRMNELAAKLSLASCISVIIGDSSRAPMPQDYIRVVVGEKLGSLPALMNNKLLSACFYATFE